MKFAMADGRGVGQSYIPDCQLNYNLQEKYGLMDTHDYRYFLQQNSEKIKKDLGVSGDAESCKKCPVCQASLVWLPKDGHIGGSQQIAPHQHEHQQNATTTLNSTPKSVANKWDSYL